MTHARRPHKFLIAFVLASPVAPLLPGQLPGWSPRPAHVPGDSPAPAGLAMVATDVARGVVVSFGTYPQGNTIANTWEWGGTVWTPRPTTSSPPPRVGATLVHDPLRHRTILFGGSDPGTGNLRSDLWEWDGIVWTQRVLGNSPSPREDYGIAFDAARGQVVLHGGRIGQAGIGAADTWVYDGTAWTQRNPVNAPTWRQAHRLAYDAARQRIVTFGGYPSFQNETWEWDGTNWQQRVTAVAPPGRVSHTLLYDAVRQRTVLSGGYGFSGSFLQDSWEWDGSAWTQRATSLPFPSVDVPTTNDATTGAAIAFDSGTLWRWNGAAWTAQQTMSWPPKSDTSTSACTDTVRNRVVAMVPNIGSTTQPVTWEWDGIVWTRQAALGPSADALAFDAGRALTVLFSAGQTWEWNGLAWAQRTPPAAPQVRTKHAICYDAARQRVVLFGGSYFLPMQGPQFLGDTWTYDGVNWVQHATPTAPSARLGHALAYDPVRQRVVLFGGTSASTLYGDTWEWNGTSWTALQPAVHPSGRLGHAMTFEPSSQSVVLFGGVGATVSQLFADTWRWDGTAWTQLVTARAPSQRYWHAMASDPATGQVMVHGGIDFWNSSAAAKDDTWLLGTPIPATATPLGSACAAGTPPVLTSPTPYLGNTDFHLEVQDTAPGAACVLGLSFATQAQPLGPCTLWLQNSVASLFLVANAWGITKWPIPVPYAPSLLGLTFTAQAGVLANPGAWSGIDFTAARTILIGN